MKLLTSICLVFLLIGCEKSNPVPDCIELKIDGFKSSALCSNASIMEYSFQGEPVYVFSHGNCPDGVAGVLDRNCNSLGYLGGIIGNTKIKGVDFGANAQYIRTLWHN
jgi:hypothetical protein